MLAGIQYSPSLGKLVNDSSSALFVSSEHLQTKVERLSGIIACTGYYKSDDSVDGSVQLVIYASKKYWIVQLGPVWYLQMQTDLLRVGALVEVSGTVIQFNGRTVLRAYTVVTEQGSIELRDNQGRPYWRGSRNQIRHPYSSYLFM